MNYMFTGKRVSFSALTMVLSQLVGVAGMSRCGLGKTVQIKRGGLKRQDKSYNGKESSHCDTYPIVVLGDL